MCDSLSSINSLESQWRRVSVSGRGLQGVCPQRATPPSPAHDGTLGAGWERWPRPPGSGVHGAALQEAGVVILWPGCWGCRRSCCVLIGCWPRSCGRGGRGSSPERTRCCSARWRRWRVWRWCEGEQEAEPPSYRWTYMWRLQTQRERNIKHYDGKIVCKTWNHFGGWRDVYLNVCKYTHTLFFLPILISGDSETIFPIIYMHNPALFNIITKWSIDYSKEYTMNIHEYIPLNSLI